MKENPLSFHLNLNPEDFLPATEEEKQSQVIMRESVSFWKDGMRRLLKNKVAMVSAFVILIGIPYSLEIALGGMIILTILIISLYIFLLFMSSSVSFMKVKQF